VNDSGWTDEVEEVLIDWRHRARDAQYAHHETEKFFSIMHYLLGIPSIVLSTLVGTSVFYGLEKLTDPRVKLLVGVASVTAAILTALQTFLAFSDKAEKHRTYASKYGSLRGWCQQISALPREARGDARSLLDQVRTEKDRLAASAPAIPGWIWRRAKAYEARQRATAGANP
jgi:hypothetical protein